MHAHPYLEDKITGRVVCSPSRLPVRSLPVPQVPVLGGPGGAGDGLGGLPEGDGQRRGQPAEPCQVSGETRGNRPEMGSCYKNKPEFNVMNEPVVFSSADSRDKANVFKPFQLVSSG